MKDSELQFRIRSARIPERDLEYWNAFPERVLRNVGRRPHQPSPTPDNWLAPLCWSSALGLACVAVCFFVGHEDRQAVSRLLQPEQQLRRQWAAVPQELYAIMQDEHGLHRLIADPP